MSNDNIIYKAPYMPQYRNYLKYVHSDRNWERIIAMKTKRKKLFWGYDKYRLRDALYMTFELMFERFMNTSEYVIPYRFGKIYLMYGKEYETFDEVPKKSLYVKPFTNEGRKYKIRCELRPLTIMLTNKNVRYKPSLKILNYVLERYILNKNLIIYDYGEEFYKSQQYTKSTEKIRRMQRAGRVGCSHGRHRADWLVRTSGNV